MNKKISYLTLILFLAACSSNVKKFDKTHINNSTTYKIEDVKLSLNSRCEGKSYPTENELKDIFTKKIKESFCQTNACNNGKTTDDTINIEITIGYKRVFMGEGFICNEAYGNSSMVYSYNLIKNNEAIFSQPESSEMVINKGFLGNMKAIATQLSTTGNADDELEDITIFSNGIVKDIVNKIKD